MPKLSASSLEKRFTCPHCGESLRTRQGLAGHIQFKHNEKQIPALEKSTQTILKAKKLKEMYQVIGYSEYEARAKASVIARWALIQAFCDSQQVSLSAEDFKTYLIAAEARRLENDDLRKALIQDFKRILGEYM